MSGDLALTTGLISGIDSAQLVEALTSRQREPINRAERQQHLLTLQKEEYQSVNSAMFAVEDSLLQLSLNATFNKKLATSSTDGILSALATTDAEKASYEIDVTQLAEAQKIASDKQSSSTESLSNSESTIEINGVSLIINEGVSLNGLKDAINATKDDTNVSATVLDNTLMLTSEITGQSGSMVIKDSSGTLLADLGMIKDGFKSQIGAEDIKGELARTNTTPGFVATAGTVSVAGQEFTLAGGESLQDMADAINNSQTAGLSAFVDNDQLGIINENGSVDFQDVDGTNAVVLLGMDATSGVIAENDASVTEFYNTQDATISVNGTDVDIAAYSGLNDIVAAINGETGTTGVSATLGSDGQISYTSTSGDIDIQDVTGSLATDLELSDKGPKNILKAAQDAILTVDGLQVTRSDNKIDDLINDVTLTLEGEGETTLTVDFDKDQTRGKIEDFVDKYNTAIELIYDKINVKKDFKLKGLTKKELGELETEDIESKEAALRKQALKGDPIMQRAYNTLRSISYSIVDGSGKYGALSEIGLTTGKVGSTKEFTRIGKLQFSDTQKFDDSLNNMEDLRLLFAQEGQEDDPLKKFGLAERFKDSIREYTSFTGFLTKKAGRADAASFSLIDTQIATLEADIFFKNRGLIKYQETLLSQFSNMETALSKLQDQSQQLLSQNTGGF
jgi:flagellar hook-associated protein 2